MNFSCMFSQFYSSNVQQESLYPWSGSLTISLTIIKILKMDFQQFQQTDFCVNTERKKFCHAEGNEFTKCRVSLTAARKLAFRGRSVLKTTAGRTRLLMISGRGQVLDWKTKWQKRMTDGRNAKTGGTTTRLV